MSQHLKLGNSQSIETMWCQSLTKQSITLLKNLSWNKIKMKSRHQIIEMKVIWYWYIYKAKQKENSGCWLKQGWDFSVDTQILTY